MGAHVYLDQSNVFFLTVTTWKRQPWLADPQVHQLLCEVWQGATDRLIGDYAIMPDHLHAFCAPRVIERSLETWVSFWKRQCSRKLRDPMKRFQSRAWHHRLRNGESYREKWDYVRANPVRKGLVETPDQWPYQGRMHVLTWAGRD